MKLKEIKVSCSEISKLAKQHGYKLVDLTDKSDSEKQRIRITNNDALCAILKHFKVPHKREKVKTVLHQSDIPDYEIAMVRDGKHANYHNTGFTGGRDGKDDPNLESMDIEEAFFFIKNS